MSNLAMVIQNIEKEVYGDAKADQVKDAVKELSHELFEQETAIENVIEKLEKASLVLSRWEQEYSFSEAPDPRAAIRWGSQVPSQNQDDEKEKEHGKQSFKWFCEYNYIFQFISIVSDYVYESKKLLEKAVYSKGEKH